MLYRVDQNGIIQGGDLLADCHRQTAGNYSADCQISSLAIPMRQPQSPVVLWIGQGGGDSTFTAIMKSVDGGMTWQSKFNAYGSYYKLAASPSDPNVIWALTDRTTYGIWVLRSADGGNTWLETSPNNAWHPADHSIITDLLDPQTAWVSTSGLYWTEDGNRTWDYTYAFFSGFGLNAPNALYGSQDEGGVMSISVSVDRGAHWFRLDDRDQWGQIDFTDCHPISVAIK